MTIEIATFALAEGADEEAFVRADAAFQRELMVHGDGMLRRTTARGESGRWAVVTLWRSPGDADASLRRVARSEAARELERLVDPTTHELARYEELPG